MLPSWSLLTFEVPRTVIVTFFRYRHFASHYYFFQSLLPNNSPMRALAIFRPLLISVCRRWVVLLVYWLCYSTTSGNTQSTHLFYQCSSRSFWIRSSAANIYAAYYWNTPWYQLAAWILPFAIALRIVFQQCQSNNLVFRTLGYWEQSHLVTR